MLQWVQNCRPWIPTQLGTTVLHYEIDSYTHRKLTKNRITSENSHRHYHNCWCLAHCENYLGVTQEVALLCSTHMSNIKDKSWLLIKAMKLRSLLVWQRECKQNCRVLTSPENAAVQGKDALDLRHFGPKTFRHWRRSVHWTFRHHQKNPRHFGTSAKVSARHFGTTYTSYTEVSH